MRDHAIAGGLMMRATGDTMIMSPPLIWTRQTIDLACERIVKALDLAEAELRPRRDRRAEREADERRPSPSHDRGFSRERRTRYLAADSLVAFRTLISWFSPQ